MVSGLEYMTTDSNCKLDQIQVFCEDVVCTLVGRESLVETQHCAIGLCLAKCQFNICLKEFFLLQIFKGQDSWQEIFQRLLLYFLFFGLSNIDHQLTRNATGKGRVESSDDEGSFNDGASMVSDVSEVSVTIYVLSWWVT